MIRSLNRLEINRGDHPVNIKVGKSVKMKMIGEDLGMVPKGSFKGELLTLNDKHLKILNENKAKLEQEGFGMKQKVKNLRKSILRDLRTEKTRGKQKSLKRKLVGSGVADDVVDKLQGLVTELNINRSDIENVLKKGTVLKKSKDVLNLLMKTALTIEGKVPSNKVVEEVLKKKVHACAMPLGG
jgi:hypothetical protein